MINPVIYDETSRIEDRQNRMGLNSQSINIMYRGRMLVASRIALVLYHLFVCHKILRSPKPRLILIAVIFCLLTATERRLTISTSRHRFC